jgi:tetratricopeptide (TPR) repeat protein/HEAT repeat protein
MKKLWKGWIAGLFLAVFFGIFGVVRPVAAQRGGQWGLRKDPCNATLLARYYGMLERNPNDSFPMRKLRKCRSAAALIRRYQAKVKKRPKWYAGHVILGHLYVAIKKPKKAIGAYRKAIAINPKASHPHLSLGNLLKKLKKPTEALKAYQKALNLAQKKVLKKKILRAAIQISMAQKKLKQARRYFRKLLALEPKNRYLRGEYARMLTRNLLYKKALAEYKVLLKQARGNNKRYASLLKEVGEVYEKMGKDPKAIATYRKAMKKVTRSHWLRRELVEKVIAIYRRKEDIKSLASHYEKKWRHKGLFEWRTLAQLYDEMGKQAAAIKAYRKALRMRSSAVDTRDKLIALLERAGRHEEALAELEKQVRLAPGEPRYQIRLAKKLWRKRSRQRAIALLKRCGRRFPRDGSVQTVLADLFTKWGRPDLALRQYQKLVRIEPTDAGHIISLGEQYWQRGKKSRALSIWRKLLRSSMFDTRVEAYATLGSVYSEHEMLKKAIDMYKKALRLSPKNVAVYRAVAPVYKRARQYKKAVDAWQKVIDMATAPAKRGWRREARTAIISLWHAQGKLKRKLVGYRKRFNRKKPDLEAGYFLGEAYIKLKKFSKAEQVFKDIIKHDKNQHEALLALQDIYRRQYKLNKAIEVLKKLAVVLPNRTREFYMRIAELALLVYRDDMALRYVKKALSLSRSDAYGWARIAKIYEKQEDYKAAINAYKQALKIRKRFFKVHFALAKLYLRQGQHLEASRLYHEVVQRSPEEHMVAKAGDLAVDLDEYLGRLHELERELIPLAFTYTHKPVYRKLLVKVYSRMIPALVRKKRYAVSRKERRSAHQELLKIGGRALKPLLEALSSGQRKQQLMAVDLLGHLGNPGAAPTLVRLALNPPVLEEEGLGVWSGTSTGSALVLSTGSRPPRRKPKPKPKPKPKKKSKEVLDFQVRAIVAAGRLANPRTASDLVKLLDAEEVALREAATWALAQINSPVAFKALAGALEDKKVGVQCLACIGLGGYGAKGVGLLSKAVRDRRRREEVRAACAWGLGLTGQDEAAQTLLEILGQGRGDVQLKAAWALGLLAKRASVRPLIRVLWSRRGKTFSATQWALIQSVAANPSRRNASSRSERALRRRRSEGRGRGTPPTTAHTVGVGTAAFKEMEVGIAGRLPVLEMIQRLEPAQKQLLRVARRRLLLRYGKAVEASLAVALARHRDLVVQVLQILDSQPVRVGLGALDPATAETAGEKNSAQGRVAPAERKAVARLERIVNGLSAHLERLCAHRDATVRALALSVLVKSGASGAPRKLRTALRDKSATVRRSAVRSAVLLARHPKMDRSRVADLLVEALKKMGWIEKRAALRGLGRLGVKKHWRTVGRYLRAQNGFVAQAAAEALGRLRATESIPLLVRAARQAIEPVRFAAVRALGRLGGDRARKTLAVVMQEDVSPRVRRAARRAHQADND